MTHPFLEPSPYESDAGHLIGRHPQSISADEWAAEAGNVLIGMMAIRAKCLDCCGGSPAEVRKCVSVTCALWPLRMGCQPKGLRAARMALADDAAEADQ